MMFEHFTRIEEVLESIDLLKIEDRHNKKIEGVGRVIGSGAFTMAVDVSSYREIPEDMVLIITSDKMKEEFYSNILGLEVERNLPENLEELADSLFFNFGIETFLTERVEKASVDTKSFVAFKETATKIIKEKAGMTDPFSPIPIDALYFEEEEEMEIVETMPQTMRRACVDMFHIVEMMHDMFPDKSVFLDIHDGQFLNINGKIRTIDLFIVA